MIINPKNINISKLPSVYLEQKNDLPNDSGIYIAIDSQNNIKYIGQSINIKNRWINHHRHKQLQRLGNIRVAYLLISNCSLLKQIEQDFIDWFEPTLNFTKVIFIDNKEQKIPNKIIRIRWKLNEVMARHRITGKALAEELNMCPESISKLRTKKTMPSVNGDKIEHLLAALTKLAGNRVAFADLYEESQQPTANQVNFNLATV